MKEEKAFGLDLNLLYWSEDERTIDPDIIRGKCYVRPEKSITCDIEKWTEDGQYRFYYNEVDGFRVSFGPISSELWYLLFF